jgi:hypothetical protein
MTKSSANPVIKENAKIVQFADDKKTLPNGSKIIYAENEDKIVLYHKPSFEIGITYVYDRKTGKILINGKEGNNKDKREMIKLGAYFIENSKDDELITLNIKTKDKK